MSSRDRRRQRQIKTLPPLKRGQAPWDGRSIRCALCGAPGIAGDRSRGEWRSLELDGQIAHYVCPSHFPPDGASAEQFAAAYEHVFRSLALRLNDRTQIAYQGAE